MPEAPVWNDRYASGNQRLDAQHQELFQLIGDLNDSAGFGTSPARVGHYLERFRDHCIEHFREEEVEMRRVRYPHADRHATVHRVLTERVLAMIAELDQGVSVTLPEIEQVCTALVRHVQIEDAEMAAFMRGVAKDV